MTKKVLITGATGQTGSFLVDFLLANEKDWEIHCTRRWRSSEEHIGHFRDKVKWHSCEMKDYFNVFNTIKKIMPDRIYLYSASSFVRDSWLQPGDYVTENTSHLLNVMNSVLMLNEIDLDSLKVKLKYNPKIFIALSSEEYGKVELGTQITEETPLNPISPYGVSKVACDMLAKQYYESYGLNAFRFRSFNHESYRRGHQFVSASFCKQIALFEKGLINPVLCVGDTSSERDWSDARDVVSCAWVAMNDGNCVPGEVYNICSETHRSIDEMIERLRELSTIDFKIRVDERRIRPSDVKFLYGNCSKLKKITNWKPKYDFFKDTLPEMLDFWRNKIEKEVK